MARFSQNKTGLHPQLCQTHWELWFCLHSGGWMLKETHSTSRVIAYVSDSLAWLQRREEPQFKGQRLDCCPNAPNFLFRLVAWAQREPQCDGHLLLKARSQEAPFVSAHPSVNLMIVELVVFSFPLWVYDGFKPFKGYTIQSYTRSLWNACLTPLFHLVRINPVLLPR